MFFKKNKKLKFGLLIVGLICLITLVFLYNIDWTQIKEIPQTSFLSYDDIDNINNNNVYGKFVKVDFDKQKLEVGKDGPKVGKVIFKLFGLIPIKEVEVEVLNDCDVYLGGNAVGFSIKTDGVLVVNKNSVMTDSGPISICENLDIRSGDIITHIDGKEIKDANEIPEIINNSSNSSFDLTVKRNDKTFNLDVPSAVDKQSKKKKLGLWVRDDATGIGTLTYVDEENLEFGALGHPITDGETGTKIDIQNGSVYSCSIVGVEKGEKGKPGELKGVFLSGKNNKGQITSGTEFGIFGKITDKAGVIDENITATVGGRLAVKPGKAQIVSSVSGVREYYDIEIIKASKQNSAKDRSMVFRVTDKRLLDLTGGIIQGMSGSPIIQNGKLIGAVTHVFVSDPTKGYGIYIDWMLI